LDRFVLRLKSGALVMGETQPLIGYCLLLADPVVPHFNALTHEARAQWALDLGAIGDALLEESGILRVNYETWGNLDPALHTHIVPRSKFEDVEKGRLPAREAYDYAKSPRFDLENMEHRSFLERLRARLRHLPV
jgi:diadenosine tetraphosphate (Ap4A) HIT family hydrolase